MPKKSQSSDSSTGCFAVLIFCAAIAWCTSQPDKPQRFADVPATPNDIDAVEVPAAEVEQPVLPAQSDRCLASKTCPNMVSCEEAYFYLNECGDTARDGDGDGVPCEQICPGG